MMSLYCYGDPEANGNETDDQAQIERQFQKEDDWDARFDPAAVATVLTTWLEVMGRLSDWAGKGRSPIAAECQFVAGLAASWVDELGCAVSDSRGQMAQDDKNRQKGPFADFVRAAAEIIPPEFQRGVRWDHAIKETARSFRTRE
jgi:hypothetical protein